MTAELPGVTTRVKQLWDQVDAAKKPSISQRRFATKYGLDPQQFNQWVNGKSVPSLPAIMRLAEVFGVPWQWLVIGDDGMKALKKWDDAKRPHADVRELARDDSPPGRVSVAQHR